MSIYENIVGYFKGVVFCIKTTPNINLQLFRLIIYCFYLIYYYYFFNYLKKNLFLFICSYFVFIYLFVLCFCLLYFLFSRRMKCQNKNVFIWSAVRETDVSLHKWGLIEGHPWTPQTQYNTAVMLRGVSEGHCLGSRCQEKSVSLMVPHM